ncbi:aquaporin-7 [Lingula anatina]|uniref:Aquaporin-7 n=1 Tax=Lingula anatina TaxID=7574 RepID=A0A1S3JV75_LINAN|nr:aquaporin-7 [Lingula anatina]|eukprot:XP_013414004.1 aquaporin-7 [Lingula anatina]
MGWRSALKRSLHISNKTCREALAEFVGTFILIVFGCGSVAQKVFGKDGFGDFFSVNWSWGLGVALGVFFSGGVSGGHINPAVSVTMAVLGRLKWSRLPFYIIAQYLGAFLGSACVYAVYLDALTEFDGGVRKVTGSKATAGIWCTFPQPEVTTITGFIDQVFGTALLLSCILAITDRRNMEVPKPAVPLLVGLLVLAIGAAFGYNCGYAINPARDLAPRIFITISGWGAEAFSFREYNWFWVPIIGPHVGALLGAFIYQIFVGLHWPEDYDLPEENNIMIEPSRGFENGGIEMDMSLPDPGERL